MSFVGLYWRARCKTLRMWKWAFQISFQVKSLGFLRSVLPVEHISKDKDKPDMSKYVMSQASLNASLGLIIGGTCARIVVG
jgi:hypothetical protein